MPKLVPKTFVATLERAGSPLHWTIARIPFDVHKVWGKRGQVRVDLDINGERFETSLFPRGDGHHFVMVNKKMQAAAGIRPGMQARFRVAPNTSIRKVVMPREVVVILGREKALRRWFDTLSASIRNEIARWIADVKHPETRKRRAEQMAERLMQTMDAEEQLPPAIATALDREPSARAGWEKMTPTQRRGFLLGIFHYRTPEGRARRIAKTVEAAREIAERKRR